MTPAEWQSHVEAVTTAPNPEREREQARRLTLEFAQPLIQEYRRRRPRRRGQGAPMFDPQQTSLINQEKPTP